MMNARVLTVCAAVQLGLLLFVVPPEMRAVQASCTYPPEVLLDGLEYDDYVEVTGTPPGYLVSYTDPDFGHTVTRISDATAFGLTYDSQRVRHHYSNDCAWNADQSLIRLSGYPAAVLDGDDYSFLYWSDIPSSAKWSYSDPALMFGTLSNRLVTCTGDCSTRTTLRTFDLYAEVDFGYSEGSMSVDDRFILLIGDDTDLFVYDLENDEVTGTYDFSVVAGELDWASVSPSGSYVVLSWKTDGFGDGEGFKVMDRDFTNERDLFDSSAHSDMGYDQAGNEVIVSIVNDNTYEIAMTRLSDGVSSQLYRRASDIYGGHVSCRNFLRPGYCYITSYYNDYAPNEIFAMKLDDTDTMERFVIHHSDNTAGYGHQAQATVSPDGTKVIWAGNYDNYYTDDYAPSWLVEVEQTGVCDPTDSGDGDGDGGNDGAAMNAPAALSLLVAASIGSISLVALFTA